MKLIIDIPKAWGKCKIGFIKNCIRDGIELSSLTNGEVMQKMFPQMEIISANPFSVYVEMKECNQFNNIVSFDVDWWNAKWGE